MSETNFVLLVIGFGFVFATYLSFGVILSPVFAPLGLSSVQISLIGTLLVVAGVFSSTIVGAIVQKWQLYKITMLISCWGTAASFFAGLFDFKTATLALVVV